MNILLVDTNFSSFPIYEALVSWGYKVYTIGRNPNDFMAKNFPNHIQADYSNIELLRRKIKDHEINFIIPGCNDHSYQSCAFLSKEKYSINIDDSEKTDTLLNKKKFRSFCCENNLPAPRCYTLDEIHSLNLEQKIIVKPVDAFSGKGITSLQHTSDFHNLQNAIKKAKIFSRKNDFVIEDFVQGQLFSHTAFIVNKAIVRDFIVEEHSSSNPFTVDTSFVKLDFPLSLLKRIRSDIETIARLLELSDGLIHTQFIAKEKKYWLIEITRRCPGDLYSQLIQLSTGFNYAEIYASFFTNKELEDKVQKKRNCLILRHTITKSDNGILNHIDYKENIRIEKYISILKTGDAIAPESNGRIGVLFINARTKSKQKYLMKKFISRKVYNINTVNQDNKNE